MRRPPVDADQAGGGPCNQERVAHRRFEALHEAADVQPVHQRKLDMFGRLRGDAARETARAFWTNPCEATWAPYQQLCTPLYNTRPPADPLARERTVFNTEILFASAGGEQRTMNLLPGLARVMCPVLVMAGVADPVTPLADAQEIAAAIPDPWGRIVTFANAGHGAWRDEPEAAMRVIRDFVTA